MDEQEIRSTIWQALKGIAPEVEPDEIAPDDNLRDQIDLDSMDFLNFIIALHEKLKVEIPEEDYGKLGTLNKLVAYLVARTS